MQVIVKLTNACNLRCKYCSEGDYEEVNNLSFSLLQKLVDDLPELLDNIGENSIDFLWHGGEPLCYPKEMLCQAMDYAIKRLSDKYRVSFSMQSNGTLINGDWIRIIKQYNIVGYEIVRCKKHDNYTRNLEQCVIAKPVR